jgi:hypothetical protein
MADIRRKMFTDHGLELLQYGAAQAPSSGRMEIKDALRPGLILRVTPRGVKTFSVIYRIPGEGGVSQAGR